MSTKAVTMMIIMRTDRNYDGLSCTLPRRDAVKNVLAGVRSVTLGSVSIFDTNTRTDETSRGRQNTTVDSDLWLGLLRPGPASYSGGVHIPATAQECNRRNSSNNMDISARSASLLHRKVTPDGQWLHLYGHSAVV